MTRSDHASGTERLAEAVAGMDCDIVINLQGDEPLINPAAIRDVIAPFENEPGLPMATLAHTMESIKELHDPHIVKVVCDASGHAMYFSRAAIPYPRGEAEAPLKHVGLYAYRKAFLLQYPKLAPCPMEAAEHLEQLRVLYHGYPIAVTTGCYACIGVDTPEDLKRAEATLNAA
jgi:3-deoxy-manno-octulosonate cytidylyltransferase (CMP-KDO synthetase)